MSTVVGSGIFAKQKAEIPHLSTGEVADLRKDVAGVLGPLLGLVVVEYTNPVGAAPQGLEAPTATTVAPRTVTSFLQAGKDALLADGRNVTFTTAGGTPADAPATALITGTGMDGKVQTETVNIAQTAAVASGVKPFKTVASVAYSAADGTGATVSIGFGPLLGLPVPMKTRAGLAGAGGLWREIAVGAVVTNGVVSAANGTYAPNTAPNGSADYCIYYEGDATVIADQ